MTDILYSLIFVLPLLLVADSTAFTTVNGASLALMITVACVITVLINLERKLRLIVSGSMLALMLGLILVTDAEQRMMWLESNAWLPMAMLETVCAVIAGMLMARLRTVRLTVCILLTGVLLSSYWTDIITEKIGLVSIVFLFVTVMFEEIRHRERGDDRIRSYVVRIVPFLLVGMIALYYMPASDSPYDWSGAKHIIRKLSDEITEIIQYFSEDSMEDMEASLGFGEKAEVSGDVYARPEEMMKVVFGHGAPKCIYLDGKYFEDFDGRSWTKAETTYPYMMDTIEACCATSQIERAIDHDSYRSVNLEITYSGQNTQYVFVPVKSLISDTRIEDITLSFGGNEILFDKKRGNTTSYSVSFLVLNQDEEILSELMGYEELTDRKKWETECARHGLRDESYSYDAYLLYKAAISDSSLCPNSLTLEELSPEVRKFLEEATAGAETKLEILRALEKAFAEFEYTTTPGAVPEYVTTPSEFLDYFLLEARKGYCNSFATAFVLLCQVEGIPARYVHGYCVPKSSDEVTYVYNTMAHAYPEAYLEGVGWMVFEPTPGYSAGSRWDKRGRYEVSGYMYYPEEHAETDRPEPTEAPVSEDAGIRWYMIVIPIALALIMLAVLILVERAISVRRFNRLSREERARVICHRIIRMLRTLGVERADGETIREYAARVSAEQHIEVTAMAAVLEKLLYSSEALTDAEIVALRTEYAAVRVTGGRGSVYIFLFIYGFFLRYYL